jgi:hypothetical protein
MIILFLSYSSFLIIVIIITVLLVLSFSLFISYRTVQYGTVQRSRVIITVTVTVSYCNYCHILLLSYVYCIDIFLHFIFRVFSYTFSHSLFLLHLPLHLQYPPSRSFVFTPHFLPFLLIFLFFLI